MFSSSPLQYPPSMIPFPELPGAGNAQLTVDFIDYGGVFSALQCLAINLPFVVVTKVEVDDDRWSPAFKISRDASFERVTWPAAVQRCSSLTLILSTPSEPRPRPTRVTITTLHGERHFLRLDLWETLQPPPAPEDEG